MIEKEIIREKMFNAIVRCKELIFDAEKESSIQNYLKEQLKCEKRVIIPSDKFPKAEIDLYDREFIAEIKFRSTFYHGIGQVIMLKELHGYDNIFIVHVKHDFTINFKNAFFELLHSIDVDGILINQISKKIFTSWR